jgi:hypothetical protein
MTRSPRRLTKQVRDAVGEHVRDLPIQATRVALFGIGRALLLSDRVTKDYKELRRSGPRPVLDRLRGDVQHLAGKAVSRVAERVTGSSTPEPPIRTRREGTWPAAAARPETARPETARPETARPETARPESGRETARPDTTVTRLSPKANRSPAAEPEIAVGKPAARPAPEPKATPEPEARPKATPEPEAMPKPEATPKPEAAPKPKATRVPKATPEPEATPAKAEPKAAQRKAAAPAPEAEPLSEPATAGRVEPGSLPIPDYDQATLPSLRARLRGLSADQVGMLRAYERENAARPGVLRMYENRMAKLREQP